MRIDQIEIQKVCLNSHKIRRTIHNQKENVLKAIGNRICLRMNRLSMVPQEHFTLLPSLSSF